MEKESARFTAASAPPLLIHLLLLLSKMPQNPPSLQSHKQSTDAPISSKEEWVIFENLTNHHLSILQIIRIFYAYSIRKGKWVIFEKLSFHHYTNYQNILCLQYTIRSAIFLYLIFYHLSIIRIIRLIYVRVLISKRVFSGN